MPENLFTFEVCKACTAHPCGPQLTVCLLKMNSHNFWSIHEKHKAVLATAHAKAMAAS